MATAFQTNAFQNNAFQIDIASGAGAESGKGSLVASVATGPNLSLCVLTNLLLPHRPEPAGVV